MVFDGYSIVRTDTPSGANVFSYLKNATPSTPIRPVLVLLHGYPQNNLMWKEFVKNLPSEWDVLVPDLPGYGNSTKPIGADSRGHSKREWAKDIVYVIDSIWNERKPLIAYGHDRGARLAYRLALDFPSRVVGAGLLDIVPTSYVWDAMRLEKGHVETKRSHHWIFLSGPRPFPDTMIASNPDFYFPYTLLGWTGQKSKDAKAEWVVDSITPYLDPKLGKDRISAACEDYRAGATFDVDDDFEQGVNPTLLEYSLALFPSRSASSSSPPFACPLLVLSSVHLRRRFEVDNIWKELGKPGLVDTFQIGDEGTGHFLVNEAETETLTRTREWLQKHWGRT